jgi:hypothetical protein
MLTCRLAGASRETPDQLLKDEAHIVVAGQGNLP